MAACWPGEAAMRAAGLDPKTYTDLTVLAAERDAVFARSWLFVGLKTSLAEHNDWLAADLAGRGVTVQNFEGALRGFRNVCSHRHARLRSTCRGNGMLRCPYHGWTYNDEGVPVGIPGNAEHFGLDRDARRALALPQIAVACCGNLVFARLAPEGPSLEAFLGDDFAVFARASEALASPFAEGEIAWRCNWKIGIESAIEGYHLGMIHPQTFKPFVREVLPARWNGDHSLGPSLLSDAARQSLERIESRLGLLRHEASDRYDHYLVFPNLCVTVTAGLTLSLQTYEPVAPDETRLRFWLLSGASGKPALRDGIMGKAVLGAFADFNAQVLEEDQAISEEVQVGKGFTPLPPAVLGGNEDRIQAFHAAWRRAMGD
jgi:choline monooxygenase